MKVVLALLGHELRGARTSLAVAAATLALLLVALHACGCGPEEVALVLPWAAAFAALQLASDSFASDLASGRLATRATLPVSPAALWASKALGFVAAVVLVAAFAVAAECAWQSLAVGPAGRQAFLAGLPDPRAALVVLAVIGALGLCCSLLVESALTAMLLTALALAAFAGGFLALRELELLLGAERESALADALLPALIVAFAALGALAFVRGQRKLGSAAVRVRVVLLGSLALVVGSAGVVAAGHWHWTVHGLEDARVQLYSAVASPGGRFLALESEASHGGREHLQSVWLLDLETSERRLLAGPGCLVRDQLRGGYAPWTEADGLCVLAQDRWNWSRLESGLRLREQEGRAIEEPLEGDVTLADRTVRRPPAWAEVEDHFDRRRNVRETRVAWRGTGRERAFEGRVGTKLVLSPEPGIVIAVRGERAVLADLRRDEERVLVEGALLLLVAPDARAVLVHTKQATHVLSTVDGEPLRAPWTKEDPRSPAWVLGDDRSHEILLHPRQRGGRAAILDLESGRELALPRDLGLCVRAGERGYVLLDEENDLILVDREGELVRVLVDRGAPRR